MQSQAGRGRPPPKKTTTGEGSAGGEVGEVHGQARRARWGRQAFRLQPGKARPVLSPFLTVRAHAMPAVKYFERRPWRWASEER